MHTHTHIIRPPATYSTSYELQLRMMHCLRKTIKALPQQRTARIRPFGGGGIWQIRLSGWRMSTVDEGHTNIWQSRTIVVARAMTAAACRMYDTAHAITLSPPLRTKTAPKRLECVSVALPPPCVRV